MTKPRSFYEEEIDRLYPTGDGYDVRALSFLIELMLDVRDQNDRVIQLLEEIPAEP